MGRKKTRFSDLNVKIGERIKQERMSQKMSRQELAEILGYEHGNSVLYWEKGTGVPVEIISKLADIFHVRVEYLMCKDDYRELWHRVFSETENAAWQRVTHDNLVEALKREEKLRFMLRKANYEIELTRIFDNQVNVLVDNLKLSSSELNTLKIIIEGIRANRKDDKK